MKAYQPFLFALLFALSCSSDTDPEKEPTTPTTVTYTASQADFPNPERGFYHYSETSSSDFNPLSKSVLQGYRTPKRTSGASYDVVGTLVFRYIVLESFKDAPLSEAFLNQIKADFVIAREAGAKLIPRFTYTISVNDGECPESFICPPYGDAPKAIVLQHIEQLKPIFQENADVIACVQMGFIGTWGENYYTDHFGDASSNGQSKLLDDNWNDRIEVLQALLDATPEEIMIQVRYPQIKQRLIYGINAPVSSAALTDVEGFSGTDKARIGFHNDCFLASSDDFGTFEDYGNSSSPRTSANTTLRKYFSDDSKFVVVGGETCSDGYSPQNDCEPAGKAEKEMRDMHYSFLNTDYNNQVNNDWVTGGCIDNIRKKLGYRLELKNGVYTSAVNSDKMLDVKITLENTGYASPFMQRPVQLILRNTSTSEKITLAFDTDIQRWFSGEHILEQSFQLNDVPAGDYELLLNMPDQHASIATRPEYSIRLANEDVWEELTGYNKLNHTVTVN
jgi:hypothetical protein